jgi:PIN domain nuclease of toxin-antitoxin system
MRILVDTNVLIPLAEEELKPLSSALRDCISDPRSLLYASVASLWEIAIKSRIGKLKLKTELALLAQSLQDMDIALLMIDQRHVSAEVFPNPDTRDPFDRLLLAQCIVEDMRLVTLDRALARHPLAWHAG